MDSARLGPGGGTREPGVAVMAAALGAFGRFPDLAASRAVTVGQGSTASGVPVAVWRQAVPERVKAWGARQPPSDRLTATIPSPRSVMPLVTRVRPAGMSASPGFGVGAWQPASAKANKNAMALESRSIFTANQPPALGTRASLAAAVTGDYSWSQRSITAIWSADINAGA